MITIFSILLSFMLNLNTEGLTATTQGQYYEVVNVQYDATVDKTYGVFVRYNVEANGAKQEQHLQLRSLDGNKTKADLIKAAPHDSNIVLIGE